MACLIIFSQLTKEKKSLDDKLQEMTQQLGDEEEKAKSLAKQKAKQDALIADLEERLRNAERVIILIPARFSRRTSSQSYVTDKPRGFWCNERRLGRSQKRRKGNDRNSYKILKMYAQSYIIQRKHRVFGAMSDDRDIPFRSVREYNIFPPKFLSRYKSHLKQRRWQNQQE